NSSGTYVSETHVSGAKAESSSGSLSNSGLVAFGPASEPVEEAGCYETKKPSKLGNQPLPPGALEEGRIYFFYRPKVQHENPVDLDDVARFYIILKPQARCPPPTLEELHGLEEGQGQEK
ncbi:hypothetical protein Vafri_1921, partial [Volvox africanus]